MAKVKAKEDKRRLEQMKEQAQRDQEMNEEIERRRRKEARRREKEVARREEERQHGQRIREEQLKLQPTPSRDSNKAPRMAHEHRDPSRQPATTRDVRHGRVKDSDESDNSLRQAATLSRHRHHHREPHSGVPGTVLSPPSQQPPHAAMTKDIHRPPTSTTILQPGERKQSKHSRTYQEAAPYPPGYAVSGSDSEHTRKDIRAKLRETSRHAHTATAGTGGTATYEPGKPSHKHGKSTGGLTNWLFNRSDERRERKLSDSRKRSPTETRHEAPLVIPSLSRVDPPPVISLKAGEGPSERPGPEHTRKRTSSIPVPPDHTDTRHMLPLEQPSSATIPSHVQALMEAHAAAQPYSSIPGKPNTQSRTPVPIIPSPHPAEHKPRGLLSSTPRPTASFRVPSPAIPIPPRIHADQTDAHRHSPASADAHRPPITAPSPAPKFPQPRFILWSVQNERQTISC
ncbi:hypothetical protein OF83DRAFT_925474 [Amylostereum chailletii]|nr:hypothetical protein OF83DRAFT_925474 [Amylostereum chailletii]